MALRLFGWSVHFLDVSCADAVDFVCHIPLPLPRFVPRFWLRGHYLATRPVLCYRSFSPCVPYIPYHALSTFLAQSADLNNPTHALNPTGRRFRLTRPRPIAHGSFFLRSNRVDHLPTSV
ncbi:hypothetical protein BCR44DRAFT_1205933 [Catenaria anguillulae PL171]|uniref:Secreted protein n=1 Tax=Catenaria anguillulae PL171 TaxID=765915 RepID=A0A1Y2HFE5_9FUNG|nr:hypothetical protein BCR44DRAFT_1205933 [Catenaria anguillulae PL171]